MNVRTCRPVTPSILAAANRRKAEGPKDACGEPLRVGDTFTHHASRKPLVVLGTVFEMPSGTTNRFGEDGGWYVSAAGYHVMANGCFKQATFRPCYLCGMPRLDFDLCDRCADACVEDAKRFECRQLTERVAR